MQLTPRYGDEPVLVVDGAVLASTVGDPAAAVVHQRERLTRVLESLDEEQWSAPSRCEGWSVRDVIAHLNGTNQFWAISIASGRRGEPTEYLRGFDPVATPATMVAGLASLTPGETLEQFVETNEGLSDAVADMDPMSWEALAEAPPGHVPTAVVLLHALWDSWIHERDVMVPLGLDVVEDDHEVAGCLVYAAALSPTFLATVGSTRTGAVSVRAERPDARFTIDVGARVVVHHGAPPDDALVLSGDAVDLVEALSFRAPLEHSVDESDRWMLDGLAQAFDRAEVTE
jgi:uncharacterized protein (TIGR03083 family)